MHYINASEWLNSIEIFNLTPEEEGAFIRISAAILRNGGFLHVGMVSNVLRVKQKRASRIIDRLYDSELIEYGATRKGAVCFDADIITLGGPAKKIFIEKSDRLDWSLWSVLRQEVFERDNYTCVYCGSTENLECDHVKPISKGGNNDLSNLKTSCMKCNRSKGSKELHEWIGG